MSYLGWRRPPRKPPAPDRPSAAIGMLAAETFKDRPFGSFAEFSAPAAPAPTTQVPRLEIPRPPWVGREAEFAIEPDPAPTEQLTALEALKARDEGYDPPDFRPIAEPMRPLVRFVPPEPDWRKEELERARRDRKQPQLDEPPKSLQSRPA